MPQYPAKQRLRASTAGVAIALALGAIMAATPAFATDQGGTDQGPTEQSTVEPAPVDPTTTEPATTEPTATEQLPPSSAEQQAFADADVELVGLGENAAGDTVVVTTGGDLETPAGQEALETLVETRGITDSVATIELQSPIEAVAAETLVGGAGYISWDPAVGSGKYCSLGFAAWSPARTPAFITAGHCRIDGIAEEVLATIPTEEPAAGGSGTHPTDSPGTLGQFGFSQYGGPGNSTGSQGSLDSIDLAVIDVDTSRGWEMRPWVTDWSTPGLTPGSLAQGATSIEQVGEPQLGQITRTGRTSGQVTGEVRPIDIIDGWVRVSGRWVHGFSSAVPSIGGDSGGPVVQGTTAVGIISGGGVDNTGTDFTWSSLLQQDLAATNGYEVALDIDAPALANSGATMGDELSIAVPHNATGLTVNIDGTETPLTPAQGVATIATPNAGRYIYTLTATNGLSQSAPTVETVTVAPPAPGITSLVDGTVFPASKAPTTVSGTGLDSATIELSIASRKAPTIGSPGEQRAAAPAAQQRFTTTVQNGKWSIDLGDVALDGTTVEAAATQRLNDVASPPATLGFSVKPSTPSRAELPQAPPVLAKTGGADFAPMGIAAGAALLLGALAIGAAAIRSRKRATR